MYILASTVIKQIEMQIELLDMQADNAWRSFFTSSIRTERAKMLGSVVESILEGIPRNVEAAETCINSTVATCMHAWVAASSVFMSMFLLAAL